MSILAGMFETLLILIAQSALSEGFFLVFVAS